MTADDDEGVRQIRWVEYGKLEKLGHGVQFLYSEHECVYTVAFLEEFRWREGGATTVRLAKSRPADIAGDRWPDIITGAREAVLAFLSGNHLNCAFRHGPINIIING